MFVKVLQSLTYEERQKKKLKKYKEKVQDFSRMDRDELEMNYIHIMANYEHRKMVLATMVCALALSILTNVWKYFFKVIQNFALLIYDNGENAEVIAKVLLPITTAVAIVIIVILLIVIWDMFKSMKLATMEKLFIENFMKGNGQS